jgi:uncharacterized membrane protein
MAKDLGDTIGTAVGRVAREAAQSMTNGGGKSRKGPLGGSRKSPLGGATGVAVGAGLAAGVPLAVKGASKLVKGLNGASSPVKDVTEKATNKLSDTAKGVVDDKIKDAGGPGGIAKEAGKSLIPGMGGGDDKDSGSGSNEPGVGKGRRMPVQQAIDVPVPVSVAYNQFTQFEEWPKFMHRVQSVSQEDETHLKFKTKIWLFSREFTAEIEEQRPDERILWNVTEGITHHGVATFHEIAPRLTRVEINVDVEPSGLIEKSARGMRHVKRAIRADLHRFKAYTMMNEEADGEWRGTIEDGEVKQQRESQSSRSSSRSSGGNGGGSGSGSGSRSRSSSRSKAASSSSGNRRSASKSSGSKSSASKSAKSPSSKRSSSRSRRTSNGSNGGDPSSSKSSSSRRKSGSRS